MVNCFSSVHQMNETAYRYSGYFLSSCFTHDFVCFSQFLGPALFKAVTFQVLVNDSVHRRRRDAGYFTAT